MLFVRLARSCAFLLLLLGPIEGQRPAPFSLPPRIRTLPTAKSLIELPRAEPFAAKLTLAFVHRATPWQNSFQKGGVRFLIIRQSTTSGVFCQDQVIDIIEHFTLVSPAAFSPGVLK
jgi:hypothetical protein